MAKKNRRRLIIIGLVIILIIGGFIYRKSSKEDKPIEVFVTPIEAKTIVQKISASGTIQPEKSIDISANISALIMRIFVDDGDSVMMGQNLISLDKTRYEAFAEQAASRLRSAEANLEKTKSLKDREEKLFDQQLISSQALESTRASYESAESEVFSAKAALRSALDEVSKTSLLAPSSGIVTIVRKEEGEMALGSTYSADVIMSIADLSKMQVNVNVNENDIVSISEGDTAEIEIDAYQDKMFYGIVTEIAHISLTNHAGTQNQVTNYPVKVKILNVPDGIRPGMSATANIITHVSKDAISIPIQSLTARSSNFRKEEGQKDFKEKEFDKKSFGKNDFENVVFILTDKDNKNITNKNFKTFDENHEFSIRKIPLEVGIFSDIDYEVKTGVKIGQMIITGPYSAISQELEDEKLVTVIQDKPKKYMKSDEKEFEWDF